MFSAVLCFVVFLNRIFFWVETLQIIRTEKQIKRLVFTFTNSMQSIDFFNEFTSIYRIKQLKFTQIHTHTNKILAFRTFTPLSVRQQILLNPFWKLTVKVTIGKPWKGRLTSRPNARIWDLSQSSSPLSFMQGILT